MPEQARMNNRPMTLIQCWDDGVTTDTRLVDIFRRHGAQATFNLNAGLHDKHRKLDWIYKDTEVWKLGIAEMLALLLLFVLVFVIIFKS